jgi:hypothetical protein
MLKLEDIAITRYHEISHRTKTLFSFVPIICTSRAVTWKQPVSWVPSWSWKTLPSQLLTGTNVENMSHWIWYASNTVGVRSSFFNTVQRQWLFFRPNTSNKKKGMLSNLHRHVFVLIKVHLGSWVKKTFQTREGNPNAKKLNGSWGNLIIKRRLLDWDGFLNEL